MNKQKPTASNNEVTKALTDEEMTILTNIQSLLGQLMTASEAGTELEQSAQSLSTQKQEGNDNDNGNGDEETEEEKKEKAKKALETTASEASTASDPAQERIEDTQSPETEEAVDEVSKAIAIILKNGGVAKEKKEPENPIIKAISDLTQVVKTQQENQSELSTAFGKMLDGIGITKQLEIASKEAGETKEQKSTPVTNVDDVEKTINFLAQINKAITGTKTEEKEAEKHLSNNQVVHKTLSDKNVLTALVTGGRTMKQ